MALAKGLGGGFPIGAVIARGDIGEAMGPGSHGTTFGGNPLAVAAGNAVMDVMDEPDFFPHLAARIAQLDTALQELQKAHNQHIIELRGLGMLRGLQLAPELAAGDVNLALREAGLLAVPAADNVLRLLPPLTISEDEVAQAITILQSVFARL